MTVSTRDFMPEALGNERKQDHYIISLSGGLIFWQAPTWSDSFSPQETEMVGEKRATRKRFARKKIQMTRGPESEGGKVEKVKSTLTTEYLVLL